VARASRGLVLTSGVIASSRMQPENESMPSIGVELGKRAAVQNEAIALGTESSRIQKVRGFREAEKHRDSWRMWGHRAPTIVSALLIRDPFIFAVPCLSIVSRVRIRVCNVSWSSCFIEVTTSRVRCCRQRKASQHSVQGKRLRPNTRREAFT
jgi:hypothetical protein